MMPRKVFITQSNYIPWKGYFDAINEADVFVVYDHVQYTKNDWRNRNRIKTANGIIWLTIPVLQISLQQKINETRIIQKNWNEKHWKALALSYAKAPFFKQYKDIFEETYTSIETDNLSEVNQIFINLICKILRIDTPIIRSTDLDISEPDRVKRLVNICRQLEADEYISGPSAKNYLDESLFHEANMTVKWIDNSGYEPYKQLYEPFEHAVSVVDLIFNEGESATTYMKSFKPQTIEA
jgi:hypothetical protein